MLAYLLIGLLALGHASARQLAGGVTEIDLGEGLTSMARKDLMDAVHFATERICESRNSPVHLKFMELTHATEQVFIALFSCRIMLCLPLLRL